MKKTTLLLLLLALLLGWLGTTIFAVEATETAIVTRFSRPLPEVYGPGPHLKLPWPIDGVIRFDKRLLVLRYRAPTEFLTSDKKNILVDSYAVWRIADEHRFQATVRTRDGAEARILDMLTAAIGEIVGVYPLTSFINPDADKLELSAINRRLKEGCVGEARDHYGVSIVDVRINGLNFPPENRSSVIRRMQAERNRIATQYRAEGEEAAMKIEATTELETRKLLAEAARQAEVARGRGEAEALRIYGEAYAEDPELFTFLRTLEAYEKLVDEDTTLVLRSDSELWRLLEKGTR